MTVQSNNNFFNGFQSSFFKNQYTKICTYCQQEFQTHINKQSYCSRSCYDQNRKKATTEKICPYCQKTFQQTRSNQKYCSTEHGLYYRNHLYYITHKITKKRDQIFYKGRFCQTCSQHFYPHSGIQKFCSDTCRKQDERKRKHPIKDPFHHYFDTEIEKLKMEVHGFV